MLRLLAVLLTFALAGCTVPSSDSGEGPGSDGAERQWPSQSIEFAASGDPGTGFLIFMELAEPREGEHEWSTERTLVSMHGDGATVWLWDFGFVTGVASDRFFTPQPGKLENWEKEGDSPGGSGTHRASVGGTELIGLVYGFASPAAWSFELEVDYNGTGFAALHHWPITGFDVQEEEFGGSVGLSTGSATFDLQGSGWTLALLHRMETYPQRGYQTSITFPSGYTCSDTWAESGFRMPLGEVEASDWFAHFADAPGKLRFEASDAGLDALESLQVARLQFGSGLPDALPFPDHAESFVSPAADVTTCPE